MFRVSIHSPRVLLCEQSTLKSPSLPQCLGDNDIYCLFPDNNRLSTRTSLANSSATGSLGSLLLTENDNRSKTKTKTTAAAGRGVVLVDGNSQEEAVVETRDPG